MKRTIFYSWQTDLLSAGNRNLIQAALEKANRAIGREEDAKILPVLDRDTANLAGAPDIANSILAKIANADVFVADVSIVNAGAKRPAPNPNVLVELGYAIAELGWENVILVLNKVYGGPELLPFDLRGRRTVVYEASEDTNRSEARGLLQGRLEASLRASLEVGVSGNLPTGRDKNLWWGKWDFNVGSTGGHLFIREVGPTGFLFDLQVSHGAHTGSVTAFARIVSNDLAYCRLPNGDTDQDGELMFQRRMERDARIIEIEETALCSFYHGMRATFGGRYVRSSEPWFDAGYMNEIEIFRMHCLLGEHLDKMRDRTSDITERDNLDQDLQARVISGGVAGLYTFMESIVMYNSLGEMWAAYLDDNEVRYFTNVLEYSTALPKTIEDWRVNFIDKPVIYFGAPTANPKRLF